MARLSSAALTDPGLRRDSNEDAFCTRSDLGLYLVADGMGGHAAGEVASRLATEVIEAFIHDTRDADLNTTWPFPYDPSLSVNGNRLRFAFQLANRRLAATMEGRDELRGMATTAAAVLASRDKPVIAHVGDSRVYLFRAGRLSQLTEDHSWVGEQVRAGVLTDADARRHPYRNVVTRALSGAEDLQIDIREIELRPGDRALLCSDGLSSVVAFEDIERIVGQAAPLEKICRDLIDAANAAGGPDNITVAMLQVDAE